MLPCWKKYLTTVSLNEALRTQTNQLFCIHSPLRKHAFNMANSLVEVLLITAKHPSISRKTQANKNTTEAGCEAYIFLRSLVSYENKILSLKIYSLLLYGNKPVGYRLLKWISKYLKISNASPETLFLNGNVLCAFCIKLFPFVYRYNYRRNH